MLFLYLFSLIGRPKMTNQLRINDDNDLLVNNLIHDLNSLFVNREVVARVENILERKHYLTKTGVKKHNWRVFSIQAKY